MGSASRRRPGVDHDGIRHHEAGEQADAEPANVVLGDCSVDQLRLGGLADHRQEAVDALLAQARAVIPENQAAVRLHSDGDFSSVPIRLRLLPQGDGVHAVLQQLPEEHIRAFIQVVGQYIQHSAQIYLKMIGVTHSLVSLSTDAPKNRASRVHSDPLPAIPGPKSNGIPLFLPPAQSTYKFMA